MNDTFEVFFDHQDYCHRVHCYVFKNHLDDTQSICTSLDKMEFVKYNPGDEIKPTFEIGPQMMNPFLQAMANALKKIGIRAENEAILENEMDAVKYHLEDMRKIVFKREGVEYAEEKKEISETESS